MRTATVLVQALLGSALLVAQHSASVFAAECTTEESTQIYDILATAATSSECSAFGSVTSTTATVTNYCSSDTCRNYLLSIVPQFPDCEVNGVTVKDSVQQGVEDCTTTVLDPTDGGSGTTTDGTSSTSSTTTCTDEQLQQYRSVSPTETVEQACSAGSAAESATYNYCQDSHCLEYLQNLQSQLPDCYVDGYNDYQVVTSDLDQCKSSTTTGSTGNSASTPSTATTSSSSGSSTTDSPFTTPGTPGSSSTSEPVRTSQPPAAQGGSLAVREMISGTQVLAVAMISCALALGEM